MKAFLILRIFLSSFFILGFTFLIAQPFDDKRMSFDIDQDLLDALKKAPKHQQESNIENGIPLSIPDPNGVFTTYHFFKNNILSDKTASEYPGIFTLTGYSTVHKDHFVNIVIHDSKISGIILKNGSPMIELKTSENAGYFSAYAEGKPFQCLTQQGNFRPPSSSGIRSASNGATLKNYTIGIVITDEFEAANGGGGAAVSAAVSVVGQMSAIYKRDMAIEFTADIRPETATFNVNPNLWGAPYGGQVVAAYFNVNEYDLGQVFHFSGANTGWAGVAGGLVCENLNSPPSKARSWSQGQDLSYSFVSTVIHEVAHMLNVSHTYNSNDSGFCNSQRVNATAFEPGAGISLMAYPGVCPFPGVGQNLTDASGNVFYATLPFFHVASLEQMVTYANGSGNSCASGTASGNTPPVANANPCNASTPTIPANTPFELIGSATDANNDNLTYSWEQVDAGPPHGGPGAACGSTTGPIFRVYEPTTSPVRYFPSLTYILNNANVPPLASIGECLPTVSRNLNFKLSVRDNNSAGGGIHCSQITVAVNASVGPLAVTAPNTAVTWAAGSSQTVTWSGSNTSSICGTVNIKLSIDGGDSYPFTLAAATPNDGTQTLILPSNIPNTTTARIRVESSCWDCVKFFDVSNVNFTVTSSCGVANSILCPVTSISLPQGDAGLNLNISNFFGFEGSNFVFNVVTSDPNIGLSRQDAPVGSGICEASGFNNKFKMTRFVINQTGLYTFNVSGSTSFPAVNIYLASTYNPTTPCVGWVGSNLLDAGGGFTSVFNTFSVNLTACTEYVIIGSNLNASTPFTTSITVSGIGTKYFTTANPASPYNGYTFIAVNTQNNQIALVNSTADFSALVAGTYCVYGINYQTSLNPATWIGQTVNTLLSNGDCLLASTNCKPVIVTSTCSSTVSNSNDSGTGSLRNALDCNTEGSTITFAPSVTQVTLTSGLTVTKNMTLQGQSSTSRPEIRTSTSGITINASKTLTLQNVDIKHSGTQTINGTGTLVITGTTVGKP